MSWKCEIRRPDHTGDTLLATATESAASITVANESVADFVTQCLTGNVYATPRGMGTIDPVPMESIAGALNLSNRMEPIVDVTKVDSVLLINPLCGG